MCNREVYIRIFEVDLVYFEYLFNYLLLIKLKIVSNFDYVRYLGVILFFFRVYWNSIVVMYVIVFIFLVVLF